MWLAKLRILLSRLRIVKSESSYDYTTHPTQTQFSTPNTHTHTHTHRFHPLQTITSISPQNGNDTAPPPPPYPPPSAQNAHAPFVKSPWSHCRHPISPWRPTEESRDILLRLNGRSYCGLPFPGANAASTLRRIRGLWGEILNYTPRGGFWNQRETGLLQWSLMCLCVWRSSMENYLRDSLESNMHLMES